MAAASITTTPAPSVPRSIYARVDFVPVGNGTFKAVPHIPRHFSDMVSIKDAAKTTRQPVTTLYKLYRAGFVDGSQASPGKIFLSVASLLEHIEESRKPEFWTPDRRARFSAGYPD